MAASSIERLYPVLENLAEGVAVSDLEGRLLHFNRAAIRMHGFADPQEYMRALPEFAGTFELFGTDGAAWPIEKWPLARVLRGEVFHGLEALVRRKRNGWERRFSYSGTQLHDADDRPFMAILTIRDVTDSQHMAAALRTSEERFRLLVDGVQDYAILMLDPEGRVKTWNVGGERLKGYKEREIVGEPMERFYTPDDIAAGLPARLRSSAAAKGRADDRGWRLRKDGTRFYAHVVLTAMYDDAGSLVGFAKVTRDITERKRAEEQSAEQRAFLRQVIDLDRNFIFAKDREGRFTLANQAVAEAYGTTVDDLIGKTDHDFNLNREEVEQFRRDDVQVMDDLKDKFVPDEMITDASGAQRWLQTMKRPIIGPDGTADMVLGVSADVTALKQAEFRIRRQLGHLSLLDDITRSVGERQDLKSIFQVVIRRLEDSLPIDFGCICLYDRHAHALTVASIGAKSEVLAPELILDAQTSFDIDDNGLGRCIEGQLVYEPDITGVRFPFPARLAKAGLGSVVMAPLASEREVRGVLIAARQDVHAFGSTECEFLRQLSEHVALAVHHVDLYDRLRQAYNDLRRTQEAAMQQERLRALGQMASGIAHDINNALSPVSLYTESMLESEKGMSDRGREYLEIIQRAVGDVAQTVARMREFYRPRERQLELAPVQMNMMVRQVMELTRARWDDMSQSRGITIEAITDLEPDLPEIMGVENEIRDALTNLIFNAVDAMPEGGQLSLCTRRIAGHHGNFVVLEVTDTGSGMDDETRRRCFEPFFTTKSERGTGLGLAMVFGMVQRHSCEVEIDTALGAGTTVRLMFVEPSAPLEATGRFPSVLAVPSELHLLLVDDDPMLRKSLSDALGSDGHRVIATAGGEEGIAAFQAAVASGEPFNAVITDLGMPYVDGRQVANAVKASSPTTPVIMLTGWGQRLEAEGEIPPDVDRVLSKPPKLREIREALAALCRSSEVPPVN